MPARRCLKLVAANERQRAKEGCFNNIFKPIRLFPSLLTDYLSQLQCGASQQKKRLEPDYYVILHTISSTLRQADFRAKSLIAVITGITALRISARQRHGPCPNNSRGEQITAVKD